MGKMITETEEIKRKVKEIAARSDGNFTEVSDGYWKVIEMCGTAVMELHVIDEREDPTAMEKIVSANYLFYLHGGILERILASEIVVLFDNWLEEASDETQANLVRTAVENFAQNLPEPESVYVETLGDSVEVHMNGEKWWMHRGRQGGVYKG